MRRWAKAAAQALNAPRAMVAYLVVAVVYRRARVGRIRIAFGSDVFLQRLEAALALLGDGSVRALVESQVRRVVEWDVVWVTGNDTAGVLVCHADSWRSTPLYWAVALVWLAADWRGTGHAHAWVMRFLATQELSGEERDRMVRFINALQRGNANGELPN